MISIHVNEVLNQFDKTEAILSWISGKNTDEFYFLSQMVIEICSFIIGSSNWNYNACKTYWKEKFGNLIHHFIRNYLNSKKWTSNFKKFINTIKNIHILIYELLKYWKVIKEEAEDFIYNQSKVENIMNAFQSIDWEG